jgi:hypothetical protein
MPKELNGLSDHALNGLSDHVLSHWSPMKKTSHQACFFTKFLPVHVQKPRIERQKKLQPVPKPVISKPTRP